MIEALAGWNSRPVHAADGNVVVQIPDHGSTRVGVLKHIVRVAVAVKIGCSHQVPAGRKSWTERPADENVVVQIPDHGSTRVGVLKHIVRVAVAD